ncbi:lipid-A-disaccharide synthase N-terminal domain-containing protein [Microvirga sp. ACRRW]|uniref:lipid-A-disaccharide synthase N-terminal domain-containing protein n=1 Tax=Microvirga sp. ACRRW TaxID=2918205 RepID=UPI001EF50BBF|nr:lipid-A-disaccharide synthase N-terminal domain-containing protein [Microvirga sp. ACRRW]MCG7394070.1 lipid-A-disaccharide synthase N-terminal domain-containing protein [Microvirga sp. ACRRW]
MLMRLSHDIGLFFYDIVVARFDLWAAFGVLAQFVFGARFIVQWIASEKAEKSVIPMGFWVLSIVGGLMTMVYGFVRRDIVIILPQMLSIFIYVRNLMLIAKDKKKTKAQAEMQT